MDTMNARGAAQERLRCAFACSRCAMHIYEHLRPGDNRLCAALDIIADYLAALPGGVAAGSDLVAAMWEAEQAMAGAADESPVALATASVVLLCRAVLGHVEGEALADIEIEAFQACWYAAKATNTVLDEGEGQPTIPTTIVTRHDIQALAQAFLLWQDYWHDHEPRLPGKDG
ncbi:MAG: hypothetical protein M3Y74_18790 [Chloroflexota bacterium]|nr:hypothetical protein [Chloroflexota bacterium]